MNIDQPRETRKGEEIDLGKLNDFLGLRNSIGRVVAHRQFPGGYSNLTYLLVTVQGEFILRRPPFGATIKSAHDMGREFKVLSLLRSHYAKIPNPILYCEDPKVIGAPFYIMERIKGLILRPSLIKEMNFSRTEMLALSEALVDNLVVLHTIDIHKTGLEQLGRQASPPAPLQSGGGNTGSKGYIARQVEGWSKRYLAAQTEVIPAMDGVITWLVDSQPKDGLPTLIHNDYKYDNIVFNVDHPPEIVGVLDWEMCTVGDPWMDLGASLAYWAEAGDGDLAKVFNVSWLPGNLTRKEVVDRYVEKSGRQISNPVFYYVFGLFKNAVIAQQIYARWKQGHSKDPRFGELIHVIRDLSSRGRDAVQRDSI